MYVRYEYRVSVCLRCLAHWLGFDSRPVAGRLACGTVEALRSWPPAKCDAATVETRTHMS